MQRTKESIEYIVLSIELRKRRKDTKKVVFFFLSIYPTKVYTNGPKHILYFDFKK